MQCDGLVRAGRERWRIALWVLALALIAGLLFPAAAFAEDEMVSGPLIATGKVTDALTDEPIAGAWVHAEYEDGGVWQWVAGAETDENGDFAIHDSDGHGADELRFNVMEAEGYLSPEYRYEDWNGETPLSDIDFALQRAPVIATGTVTDAVTGYGVWDAWVLVLWFDGHDWDWEGVAYTDESGDYTLYDYYGRGAGDYGFYAGTTHGYHQSVTVERTWDGTNHLALDFEIEPVVLAAGTVRDAATSAGIEEAWIEAQYYDAVEASWQWASFAWTAEHGAYTLYDQPGYGAGEYRFTSGALGYARQTQDRTWGGLTPLSVSFELEAAGVIATGTVTNATGWPLSNVWVQAKFYDGEEWVDAAAALTEDGTYVLYDHFSHGAGEYRFHASAPPYLPSEYVDRTWNGTTPLEVGFALELAPMPIIATGTVTDAQTGEPIVGAWVSAYCEDVEFWVQAGDAQTDENGAYVLRDDWGRGAGEYEFNVFAVGYQSEFVRGYWDGDTSLPLDFALDPAPVIEIEGTSRYLTAVAASKAAYPLNGSAKTVVIATGRNWPDALGGSALAGALDGPILLVHPNAVPAEVLAEIDRLGAESAVIVGGTVAVSDGVKTILQNAGLDVDRVAGDTRYTTADAVALRTIQILKAGPGYTGDAFVATGGSYADAVAAAPLAASQGWPLFLAHPTAGMRTDTLAAMADVEAALVLGGTAAVPQSTFDALVAEFGVGNVERLWGDTRYGTAVAIANYAVANTDLGWNRVGIATGQSYPDALAGGVLQGKMGSVMLLTRTSTLSPEPQAALVTNKNAISTVTFFGGLNAVTQPVRDAVLLAVE